MCLFVFRPNQTYRDLKDRRQLLAYREKVERGSAEENKINQLLSNQVRRKEVGLQQEGWSQSRRGGAILSCDSVFFSFSKSGGRTDNLTHRQEALNQPQARLTLTGCRGPGLRPLGGASSVSRRFTFLSVFL